MGKIEVRLDDILVAILCGGRGERLRPRTDQIPKALIPLNGRPILDYVIDFYRKKGLRQFTLCLGYKWREVMDHYADPPEDVSISFSNSGEKASMLKRIWALGNDIGPRVIVSYCDTFVDLDLERTLATHLRQQAEATIVTARIRNPFGLVTSEDGIVTSFIEKPLLNYYIGTFIVERSAFNFITPQMLEEPDGRGLVDFFKTLARHQRLASFDHNGQHITFNTSSECRIAEKQLGKFYTYSEEIWEDSQESAS